MIDRTSREPENELAEAVPCPAPPETAERRASLDAMRGFLLFNSFIMVALVPAVSGLASSPVRDFFLYQFSHPRWDGYSHVDAGFPAYMALLAAGLTLSLRRRLAAGRSKKEFLRAVVIRFAALMIVSFFFEGGFSYPLNQLRLVGIFAKMAFCMLFSGLSIAALGPRHRAVALLCFFALHWGLLSLVPVPGFGIGNFSDDGNVEHYLRGIVVGWLQSAFGVSRGLALIGWWYLSMPKILGTCLIGLFLGDILTSGRSVRAQARAILLFGIAGVTLSQLWDLWLPINKHLWTPSYALFSAGYLFVLLSAMMYLTEIRRSETIVFLFSGFGRHPLLAWLLFFGGMPFDDFARRLLGPPFAPLFGVYHEAVLAMVRVGLCWLLFAWIRMHEERCAARRRPTGEGS